MAKRFENALAIAQGACNPSGITHSMREAYEEISAEPDFKGTASITGDPAVRLMVHQLAYICGIHDGSWNDNYNEAFKVCVDKNNEQDAMQTVPADAPVGAAGPALECPASDVVDGRYVGKSDVVKAYAVEHGIPYVDVALEEGTRFERLSDGNDLGG